MSCSGCRVLRKGCSDSCVLGSCLQWIESAEAQGHATAFVAKFFGRTRLFSFISSVPEPHRPVLFQSLLFEACGRTVNPVTGAVGLLWTRNWHICQAAVETVLRGGTLCPVNEVMDGSSDNNNSLFSSSRSMVPVKRKKVEDQADVIRSSSMHEIDLDLRLTSSRVVLTVVSKTPPSRRWLPRSPSMNSEESGTTTTVCFGNNGTREMDHVADVEDVKLLNLFT